jgi:hypothetical protein
VVAVFEVDAKFVATVPLPEVADTSLLDESVFTPTLLTITLPLMKPVALPARVLVRVALRFP